MLMAFAEMNTNSGSQGERRGGGGGGGGVGGEETLALINN